ncbi:hypothetical protein HPP92_020812 [Vanilla planifolia]|uniref:DYW domain-containing protein n=1 Tax=Vanilla planifolia TaxID=51239 RepID=A0A835PXK0_VANPL|nr:hypothetical protein HPP92_021192 [Vanilla planifolia]KAG0462336.1 hypothetical protein HPP92_020812 [Vanilla planifolia]
MVSVASISPVPALANPAPRKPNRPENLTVNLASTEEWLVSSLSLSRAPFEVDGLYAIAIKTGFVHRDRVLSLLLLRYPSPSSSLLVLRSLFSSPDSPFPFNSLLSSFSRSGSHLPALLAYSILRSLSVPIDRSTLPPVLRSATFLSSIAVGLDAHSLALKTGFASRLPVATALVRFYCSLGLPALARNIFDRCHPRDFILWNTTIAGLVQCHELEAARNLFDQMPPTDRNIASWNTMVDMYCNKLGDVVEARKMFDEIPTRDSVSWNVMISGYARMGDCSSARALFDSMFERDVVSWNAIISCYVQNGFFSGALELFRMMLREDKIKPDEVTITSVLQACTHMGALNLGQWLHVYIRRQRIPMDLQVTTALVDMYGRCGSIEDAQRVFAQAKKRDSFLCGTMVDILAMHGMADEAFRVFDFMKSHGMKPNDVTIVGLLKACGHIGLVDDGLELFNTMEEKFGLSPKLEHYGCMVDLLGKAGQLNDALELIMGMPMEPSPVLWSSLLSACKIHGESVLAEKVGYHLLELEPSSSGNYILLSNVYSNARRFEEAAMVRKLMKEKDVVKKPGCSSIEVGNQIHEFLAGDRDHPRSREIYEMLQMVATRVEQAGYNYKQYLSSEEEGGRQGRMHHSEKLALAFGLMSTEDGSTIRIMKNLRVCDDCHLFLKLASAVYGRKVVVRDCHRFHHFVNGLCSCLDYW